MENKYKEKFIQMKKERREKKRTDKRSITGEEVIFIFEKVLEGWKTIRIYNTIIQNNPKSFVDKKQTETIATGNCKVYPSELSNERYEYYKSLREKVYKFHKPDDISVPENQNTFSTNSPLPS
jgi:hypothetical protein